MLDQVWIHSSSLHSCSTGLLRLYYLWIFVLGEVVKPEDGAAIRLLMFGSN